MPDRQDMFAPTRGADQGGATLVAIATTFALGAESKRLPVCLFVCLFVVVLLLLLLLTPPSPSLPPLLLLVLLLLLRHRPINAKNLSQYRRFLGGHVETTSSGRR